MNGTISKPTPDESKTWASVFSPVYTHAEYCAALDNAESDSKMWGFHLGYTTGYTFGMVAMSEAMRKEETT